MEIKKYKSTKELNEAMQNIERVVNFKDDDVEVHSDMDIMTADAYDADIKAQEHVEEVLAELDERVDETIIPEEIEATMPVKNAYTQQLKLEEDLEDFNLSEATKSRVAARDENDTDKYLDYDMFEFVYELLAAGSKGITNIAPIRPNIWGKKVTYKLNDEGERIPSKAKWQSMRMPTFMPTGSDGAEYGGSNEGTGVPQLAVDGNDIVVYSNRIEDLENAQLGLDVYGIKCEAPMMKRDKTRHWMYSMVVHVPVNSDDEILMLDEWLEETGRNIEDVMPANFVATYKKKMDAAEKDEGEIRAKVLADKKERIYNKYVTKAFNDGTLDLNDVYAEMCDELANNDIACDDDLHARFDAEFADDYEDDIAVE